MFFKEIKHDFFGLLVSMPVFLFSENIDSHGAQQLALRHTVTKLWRRNWVLGKCSCYQLPESIFCFRLTSLWHYLRFYCALLFLYFVFAYYMMPPVVQLGKTTSPLKAFVCLYAWRRSIIKILTSFINNWKKKTKWLAKQYSCCT